MSGVCKYKAYDNVLVLSHSGFRGVENLVAARRAPARRQNSQSPRWSCFRHFTGTHALSAAKLTFSSAKNRVRRRTIASSVQAQASQPKVPPRPWDLAHAPGGPGGEIPRLPGPELMVPSPLLLVSFRVFLAGLAPSLLVCEAFRRRISTVLACK